MFRSFKYAFAGILMLLKSENNAKFHLLATGFAISLAFYFEVEKWEWALIVVSILTVFAAEAFNTAIEKLCDYIQPDKQAAIGKIKDLAAAGVLFAAISAFVIGLIIFSERLLKCLPF